VLTMDMDVSLDMALLETVDMLDLEDMDIMAMPAMEVSEAFMESAKLTLMPKLILMLILSARSIMDSQFTMRMQQDIPTMLEL